MKNKYNIDQLVGMKCTHGSPGYGIGEVIESIFPYKGKPLNGFINRELWQINFVSGCFTYLRDEAFRTLLKEGKTYYKRAAGFTALEMIKIVPQPCN